MSHEASNNEYSEIMKKFINTFKIDLIHVHHLIGHTLDVFRISAGLEVPIVFTVHDFFCICPKINLLNEKWQYCNLPEVPTCNFCLSKSCRYPENYIKSWRSSFQKEFDICNCIIAPSNSAIEIICRYFPEVESKSLVIEHGQNLKKTKRKIDWPLENGEFHIAYIGALARHKGREVFYNLAKSQELSGITKWSVIGISDKDGDPGYYPNLNITVTGPYNDFNHLQEIVCKNNVHLILLPAIWPETFSFALSEAWSMGIPVLGSNLGAIQERISTTHGGWTADMSDINSVKSTILSIICSKNDYQAVEVDVNKIQLKSLEFMADQYNKVYQKNIRTTKKNFDFKFENWELYKALKLNPAQEHRTELSLENFVNLNQIKSIYSRFALCLNENGIRYTIKRVFVYCKRQIKKR